MHIEGRDEKDNEILSVIRDNARLGYTEIGNMVGLSRVAVKNRMDLMQEEGVIKGYKTIIEPESSPNGMEFILDVSVEPENFAEVAEDLAKEKELRRIVITTGRTRLLCFGYAADYQTLDAYTRKLYYRMRGIKELSFQTVFSVLKDTDRGVEYERVNEGDNLHA